MQLLLLSIYYCKITESTNFILLVLGGSICENTFSIEGIRYRKPVNDYYSVHPLICEEYEKYVLLKQVWISDHKNCRIVI